MSRRTVLFDGATGTELHKLGLGPGECPEDWNLDRPDDIRSVHRAYLAAGAEIVTANTFGANPLKYHGAHRPADVVSAGIRLARAEAALFPGTRTALDIGPSGRLLKPYGELGFDRALEAFAETVKAGADAGADLVVIETMGDMLELKAAVIAARENSRLPVYASVALGADGKLLTGGGVECVAAMLDSLGVDAMGFNCGLGPDGMLEHVEKLSSLVSRPIIVQANAGIPGIVGGKTVFDVDPARYAEYALRLAEAGADIIGGCCGTTPEHIAAVKAALSRPLAPRRAVGARTVVTGPSQAVELVSGAGTVIGERINPTGKKKLREAYVRGDSAYVLREAVAQVDAGAAILDVNCGVPGIDEAAVLDDTVTAVQSVVTVPLQIDTADGRALETALRHVNGKALVNSVNGKRESMDTVFPLVARYGGTIVALCLDEDGIPPDADGRLAIARRILEEGAKYGFGRNDFVFDALTLAVSADPGAALVTLETVRRLTEELGVNTVLGVSNVSFGLPGRPVLNNAMYTLARRAGLSAAIANPAVIAECDDDAAFDVLLGRDENCERWIERCQRLSEQAPAAAPAAATAAPDDKARLREAIRRGLRQDARGLAREMVSSGSAPVEIIETALVPALEEAGRLFETGGIFLPQLLMAADAAGDAFAEVKSALGADAGSVGKGRPVVLATVKGDIHDIGKNIVRALLENYGFEVVDLGRDVPPAKVVEAAEKTGAMLVGLSALMTTTVGAMAETVKELRLAGLPVKVCVGGAVVTEEYAASIGADFYAKDAMRTVRIAEELSR